MALFSIDNIDDNRQRLFDVVQKEIKQSFPVEDDNFKLDVTDLRYEGKEKLTPTEERNYLLSGFTYYHPLRGTLRLIDKRTGEVLSQQRKRLAAVPVLTPRGTFILSGVEYGMSNQLRLKPGIYTRVKNTGEYEAQVNIAGGLGHRYIFNPERNIFYLNIRQANIPLLPLLKALGISDQQLLKAWGRPIYEANLNAAARNPDAIKKIYKAFFTRSTAVEPAEYIKALRKKFGSFALDPDVMKTTLGLPVNKLSPDIILKTTEKLLTAARNPNGEIDDRNHLGFVRLHTPVDFFGEAINRNRRILYKYFNNVRARRDIKYFPSGVFDKPIASTIYGSGLGMPLTEINPLEILDDRYRVGRLGLGGISSTDQITPEMRNLHPSHAGVLDPLFTPESDAVGIDNRLTFKAQRDEKGNIYVPLVDVKSGKVVWRSPVQLFDKVITFPGEMEGKERFVRAIVNNQHILVNRKHIDYEIPEATQLYSPITNLIPLKQNSYAQRVSMGARMLTQAVPLAEAEAPLLQNLDPESNESFDKIFGERLGTKKAPVSGKVTRVGKDSITIESDGKKYVVPYYKDFPFNRVTFYSEKPLVAAGDKVTKGQIIATSNYVNDDGTLALGRNLKTAYIALAGMNFEDAAVLSESAAKKLTSVHMYQKWHDLGSNQQISKQKYRSIFPSKYSKELYEKYEDSGLPKIGAIIYKDEPLALITTKVISSSPTAGRLFQDDSPLWDKETPAEVIAVSQGPKFINVVVKAKHPFYIGDKLSGRFGDKHIISTILPDDQMPKDQNGEPFELVLNPLGIYSRVNLSQVWEAILGKIAKHTGKPYKLPDHKLNMREFVENELQKYGLIDKEMITVGDQAIPVRALTGVRYMMKLHHMAESKLSGRAVEGYSSEDIPLKGGSAGAKRIGLMEMLGVLAHGAYNVARDARIVRGQKNMDYWTRLSLGYDTPQKTDIPLIYNKFLAQLTGAGIYPYTKGENVDIFALTNKSIQQLIGSRELSNSETVKVQGDKLQPINGGFFDVAKTGGLQGTFWSGIKLAEPMPNPIAEITLRNLLGLTEKDFRAVLSGKAELPGYGSGPEALRDAVAHIDLPKTLAAEKRRVASLRGSPRDMAIRRIRFMEAMLQRKIEPQDFFWTHVPVLPPAYRPPSILMSTGLPVIPDVNYLYKDAFEINKNLEELKAEGIEQPADRLLLYDAIKAVVGLGNPVHPKYQKQRLRGIIKQIIGNRPKEGVVQRKLLGATVDLVGRATIIPNPELGIDEVAIPEESAWKIYKPFIVRRLVRGGMDSKQAVEHTMSKSIQARKALLAEMKTRPVIISRAPVLHKFGIMAAWPKLTKNTTMEIPPFTVTGYNADFDGDTMQFHVPSDPKAVKEAIEKMLPSKNLFSPTKFSVIITPTMEYSGGLYYLSTTSPKGPPKKFSSQNAVLAALLRGEITPDQRVVIG